MTCTSSEGYIYMHESWAKSVPSLINKILAYNEKSPLLHDDVTVQLIQKHISSKVSTNSPISTILRNYLSSSDCVIIQVQAY